jgi:hypothetical protein
MKHDLQRPFDSIESALEFMELLEQTIEEATGELEDLKRNTTTERSASGLSLAVYKIKQLGFHVQKSRRILNDLALIRGALTGERPKTTV